jgi:hypothetical protein
MLMLGILGEKPLDEGESARLEGSGRVTGGGGGGGGQPTHA